MTQPVNGFANAVISTMFNPPQATSSLLDTKSMNQPPASPSEHRNIKGIIGGVVGAVVGIALIIVIAFCVRRRRPRAANADVGDEYQYSDPKELSGQSQVSSPLEMAGEFTHIKEMEAEYPAQELPAEVPVNDGTKREDLVELESPEETRPPSAPRELSPVSPEETRVGTVT
jgi:hypothetical protein